MYLPVLILASDASLVLQTACAPPFNVCRLLSVSIACADSGCWLQVLQPALLEPLDDATAGDTAGAIPSILADAGELLRVLAAGSRARHMGPGAGSGPEAGPDACDADQEAELAERLAAGVLTVCGAAAPVLADADGLPHTVMQVRSPGTCNTSRQLKTPMP